MTWTRSLLRIKLRVLAVHCCVSALAIAPVLYLAWFRWFPPPLFFTDGGWQGLRVVFAIYLVIGPLLLFLVYHPAKTRLALGVDIGFVALAQVATLAFGGWVIESRRPMVMAFHQGAFSAVTRDAFASQAIGREDWIRLGNHAPYWAYVRSPATAEEKSGAALFSEIEGQSREQLHFLYDPLAGHWIEMARLALSADALAQEDRPAREAIAALLSRHAVAAGRGLVFRHAGRYRNALLVFDPGGRYLGAVLGESAPRRTS